MSLKPTPTRSKQGAPHIQIKSKEMHHISGVEKHLHVGCMFFSSLVLCVLMSAIFCW